MNQEKRKEVLKLMEQKEKIEDEIRELSSVLDKNGVGMREPLVDDEGFPLNTVDIYQVRHARHRIICLQNDHKNLMKQIENGLEGYYSSTRSNNMQMSTEMEVDEQEMYIHKTPFAKVNLVSEGSPAEIAGLNEDDEIVEFGTVNSTNFKNLADIAAVVQHSEANKIHIRVKRNERFVSVQLIPRKWTGKGLLGCNIVAL